MAIDIIIMQMALFSSSLEGYHEVFFQCKIAYNKLSVIRRFHAIVHRVVCPAPCLLACHLFR